MSPPSSKSRREVAGALQSPDVVFIASQIGETNPAPTECSSLPVGQVVAGRCLIERGRR